MNKLLKSKIFLGIFILIVFIGISVFGLFELSHTSEMPMSNCPYTQDSSSICENSFDHINDWRQFLNIIFPALFVFSFLILGVILYFFSKQDFLNQKRYFFKWKHYLDDKLLYISQNKIIKWLSLLENSPSLL